MSWGTKIILVFAVFVSGMLYMVFKAGSFNNDLVTTDYYEQELKYQKTIDAVELANTLSALPRVTVIDSELHIHLPVEMTATEVTTSVWLYCVADKSKDLRKEFITSDGRMVMPFLPGNKGLHEVKLSWTLNGKNYYHKEKIIL